MVAPMAALLALALGLRVSPTASAMPAIGTWLEPWYTARYNYHWTFAPEPACEGEHVRVLFGDVDGDGRDDLLRAGCGDAGDGWVVAVSNGASGWGAGRSWWYDGQPHGAERFVADLNGDGMADAAVWSRDGWHVAFSDGNGAFSRPLHVFTMECTAGATNCIQRAVSDELLWYVTAEANESIWHRYNVSTNVGGDAVRLATPSGAPYVAPFKQLFVADVNNDTRADAVAVDAGGNVFVAAGWENGSFAPFRLSLSNFTASRGAMCPAGPLLLAPSSPAVATLLEQRGGGSAMLVCASARSGYWYAAGLNAAHLSRDPPAPIFVWKYSHGGNMGGILAPSSHGHPGGVSRHNTYTDFHLARMCRGCAPAPLACNTSAQSGQSTAVCCVIPPENSPSVEPGSATSGFDTQGFERNAPALKSTNVNLWEAWNLVFTPQRHDGQWAGYDSADLEQAAYMFDKLKGVGVSFYLSDNTNGIGCDFGNTWASTLALAALTARTNRDLPKGAPRLYYATSVGVNPLGGPSAPGVLAKMEAQLRVLWNAMLNSTDEAAATIDGNGGEDGADGDALAAAAYRHPVTKKPAVVLYVEPVFEVMWDDYVRTTPGSIGHHFHVGYSDGSNWRAGLWGWMIDRSCGAPHTPATPCNETVGVSAPIRRSNDTMYISPAYAKGSRATGTKVYAARDIDWYRSQFPVAAAQCPTQLIVGAFNDYTEMNAWWPSRCPDCRTGEEDDPYLFWNATVAGLASVRRACGGL
jgi:hypothetical protein